MIAPKDTKDLETGETKDEDSIRLPRDVLPKRYDITLQPDLDKAVFAGRVDIEVEVLRPVTEIVLNSADLEITSTQLLAMPNGAAAQPLTIREDVAAERLTLTAAQPIAPGGYLLKCEFSGVLNNQLRGFYLSTFKDPAGNTQRLGITQFESTNARRAFPCWDEPDFKAVFALKLIVEKSLLAVSSMEIMAEDTAQPATKTITFAPTPVISSYLLAFVIGPLERSVPTEVTTRHGNIPLAIVHPPGQGHLCDFSKQVASFSLKFLTDFFDLGYLGDKLDLVAAPDFAFGAMENVGCVTFREILLLLEESASATPERIRACDVIAHELAHMWFGNLVTMSWWNGIWLKEAFATFMELLVCDAFEPNWKRWELFCLSRAAAMEVDGLHQTRPIEYPVKTPAEAEGMYDLLSYEKGASVVRMLEQFLTPEIFREAIRHYLKAHAYGNCDTSDLWTALEEVSGSPVDETMKSWIYEAGFPLIWVEQLDKTTWKLTQQRFSYLPSASDASEQLWQVPLVLSHGDESGDGLRRQPDTTTTPETQRQTERLLMSESSLELTLPAQTKWVLPNSGGNSFIRCGYKGTNPLQTARDELTPSERFVLLDDAWALLLSDRCDLAEFLLLLSGFKTESSLAVWTRVLGICQSLRHILPEWAEPAAQRWFRALFQPEFERLGGAELLAANEASDRTTAAVNAQTAIAIRARLFGCLADLGGDLALVNWAKTQVADNFATSSCSADLQVEAIRCAAIYGDNNDYETYLERYIKSGSPQEKDRYLNALAAFSGEAEFQRTLELSISPEVRTQDAPYLLRGALKHRRLGETAWHFVKDNWHEMLDKFPSNSIGRMLEGVTSLNQMPQDVEQFLASRQVPQAEKMIAQHLEMLKVNAAFATTSADRLGAWFCLVGGEASSRPT